MTFVYLIRSRLTAAKKCRGEGMKEGVEGMKEGVEGIKEGVEGIYVRKSLKRRWEERR